MTAGGWKRLIAVGTLTCTLTGTGRAEEPPPDRRAQFNDLRQAGKYAEAEVLGRELLAEIEATSGADSLEAAKVLGPLSDVLRRGGKAADPEARRLAERGIAIRERVQGQDHPDVASSLNGLGSLLSVAGDYAGARQAFNRALVIIEKAEGPEGVHVAFVLSSLVGMLQVTGAYGEALPLSGRAVAIVEKNLGPESIELAGPLNNLANIHYLMGDYAAARPAYERSLAIREKLLGADHPLVGHSLANLALVLEGDGDYAAARSLHERALLVREKRLGPDHPEVAESLDHVASLLNSTGDYSAARILQERALAIREKALGPDHMDVARSLNNLADILRRLGDDDAARALFERAASVWEKALGPEHPFLAHAYDSLAILRRSTGDLEGAQRLAERGLQIRETALGPEHTEVALSLDNLAAQLLAFDRAAEARAFVERAVAIRRKALGPDHPEVARTLVNLAMLRMQTEPAGALEDALEAERIARDHIRLTSRSLSEREALRYAAERTSGLDLALSVVGRNPDPVAHRSLLDALVRSRAIVLDEMTARHRAAGGTADSAILRLAGDVASARSRLANLVVRGPGDLSSEIYLGLVGAARQNKEQAERALGQASSTFAEELSRRRIGLAEVAASLPPRSALLVFSAYKRFEPTPSRPPEAAGGPHPPSTGAAPSGMVRTTRSYVALVLRQGERDPAVIALGEAGAIDDRVARWKQEVSTGPMRAGRSAEEVGSAYRSAGEALRQAIWDPVAAVLRPVERVFVAPDGALNLVNLAALPDKESGYLLEHGPILHYVSAERDMVPAAGRRRGEGLLAVGAPAFDAGSLFASLIDAPGQPVTPPPAASAPSTSAYRGGPPACGDFSPMRFGPLPATGTEIKEIIDLWERHASRTSPDVVAALELHDAAASETALKHSAPGRRVLHLATHGFFLGNECPSAVDAARGIGGVGEASVVEVEDAPSPVSGENPLRLSGLVLAGANHRAAAGPDEDDGILTAEELGSLDLSSVEWAVLSACETGVGELRAGEGVFGLRRAVQVAGAGTLIMSLWAVEDEATRAWMKALYRARLERHLDTAHSVHAASLEILQGRRDGGLSTHPFYWAAFVAAGDWR